MNNFAFNCCISLELNVAEKCIYIYGHISSFQCVCSILLVTFKNFHDNSLPTLNNEYLGLIFLTFIAFHCGNVERNIHSGSFLPVIVNMELCIFCLVTIVGAFSKIL
jgi:hypothetical protein